jgi:transcription elongation factor SPT6
MLMTKSQPFKYIEGKPIHESRYQPQFLAMLAAEAEGLVTLDFTLPLDAKRLLRDQLHRVYLSDFSSGDAKAWNGLREDVLKAAVEDHIIPSIASWIKTKLKDDAEEMVLRKCRHEVETKTELAPYRGARMERGDVPSVVAVSHGAGDPRHDSTVAVFLDSNGRFRDQIKLDSIIDLPEFIRQKEPARQQQRREDQDAFLEFLKHRKPDVVVVGGFTYATKKLYYSVEHLTERLSSFLTSDKDMREKGQTKTIFANDAIARLYQHSKRASEDFPQLSTLARYCVGLARYTQSPVNEFAAMGDQITTLSLDPYQKYVSSCKATSKSSGN